VALGRAPDDVISHDGSGSADAIPEFEAVKRIGSHWPVVAEPYAQTTS
jgi:hypothetical protein